MESLCCVETWCFPGMGISEISAKQIREFLHVPPSLDDWQAFVDAETSENFGYSVYSVDDVHRVGILDLRIDTWLNCPRLNQTSETRLGKKKKECNLNTMWIRVHRVHLEANLHKSHYLALNGDQRSELFLTAEKGGKMNEIKVNFDRNQGNLLLG